MDDKKDEYTHTFEVVSPREGLNNLIIHTKTYEEWKEALRFLYSKGFSKMQTKNYNVYKSLTCINTNNFTGYLTFCRKSYYSERDKDILTFNQFKQKYMTEKTMYNLKVGDIVIEDGDKFEVSALHEGENPLYHLVCEDENDRRDYSARELEKDGWKIFSAKDKRLEELEKELEAANDDAIRIDEEINELKLDN